MRQRVDLGDAAGLLLALLPLDVAEARERVLPVDVHRAGSADPLAARPAERQRGILLRLDLNEGVEHHGPAVVQVHGVGRKILEAAAAALDGVSTVQGSVVQDS